MTERKAPRGDRKGAGKGRTAGKESKPWSFSSEEKPKRSYRSDEGGERTYKKKETEGGDKPKRSYGSRDDKPKRSYSDRDDKPKRSYGSRDDKPKRSYGSGDDKPKRSYSDRDDKPKRSYGSRDDKPRRSYGDDKPKRSYGSGDDKPKRSYSDREDKPKRSYGSRDDKPRRSYGDDKPKRSYGSGDDKPKRSYSDREDKPKRSYGSRDDKPRRSYGDDKPKRSFRREDDERPKRRFTDEDARPKRSFREDGEESTAKRSYISSYEPEDSRVRKSRVRSLSERQTEEIKISSDTRLNKYIANSGVCSRREADVFIKAGVVSVNGEVVTELGVKVKPGDEVKFNGELLRGEKKVYLLMNKPKGYVTTVEDPHADKTVMEIAQNYCDARIYPVGRLDKNSTGVLLLTNDGDLTVQLTHPSYNKKKIYQVGIDKPLTKNDMQRLADGVELEDGLSFFDVIEMIEEDKTSFGIEIHSGRNRIIRRMFEHLGYRVSKLDRVYFAGLTKKNLKRGECRFLTDKEVSTLKMGSYE